MCPTAPFPVLPTPPDLWPAPHSCLSTPPPVPPTLLCHSLPMSTPSSHWALLLHPGGTPRAPHPPFLPPFALCPSLPHSLLLPLGDYTSATPRNHPQEARCTVGMVLGGPELVAECKGLLCPPCDQGTDWAVASAAVVPTSLAYTGVGGTSQTAAVAFLGSCPPHSLVGSPIPRLSQVSGRAPC